MSKRFFLLSMLGFFLTANTYAVVGKDNFVLKIGGGLNAGLMKAKPGSHFEIPETNQIYSFANLLGGSFAIDLGY